MNSPGTDTLCAAARCGGRRRAPQGGMWARGERSGALGAWAGMQVLGPGCRRRGLGWHGVVASPGGRQGSRGAAFLLGSLAVAQVL